MQTIAIHAALRSTSCAQHCRWLAALLLLTSTASVQAQSTPQGSEAIISDNALSSSRGVISVNQAAGSAHQQANTGAVVVSTSGRSSANTVVRQQAEHAQRPSGAQRALISEQVLSNSVGAIAINQTAGIANQQVNQRSFAAGTVAEVSNSLLDQQRRDPPSTDSSDPLVSGTTQTDIADSAFANGRGLIQITQTAGANNATANEFVATSSFGGQRE